MDKDDVIDFEDIRHKFAFLPTNMLEYHVMARLVSQETKVFNELEAKSDTVKPEDPANNGNPQKLDVLMSVMGVQWKDSMANVIENYKDIEKKLLNNEFADDKDVVITAQDKGVQYFAARIPNTMQVAVKTQSGDVLIANQEGISHGFGDYVVCKAGQDGKPDWDNMNVLNGHMFEYMYNMKNQREYQKEVEQEYKQKQHYAKDPRMNQKEYDEKIGKALWAPLVLSREGPDPTRLKVSAGTVEGSLPNTFVCYKHDVFQDKMLNKVLKVHGIKDMGKIDFEIDGQSFAAHKTHYKVKDLDVYCMEIMKHKKDNKGFENHVFHLKRDFNINLIPFFAKENYVSRLLGLLPEKETRKQNQAASVRR